MNKRRRTHGRMSIDDSSEVVSNIVFRPERADGILTYEIYLEEDFVGIYYPKRGSGDPKLGEAATTWLSPSDSNVAFTKVIKEALYNRFGPEAAKDIVVEDM